jgi:hypothetical protein
MAYPPIIRMYVRRFGMTRLVVVRSVIIGAIGSWRGTLHRLGTVCRNMAVSNFPMRLLPVLHFLMSVLPAAFVTSLLRKRGNRTNQQYCKTSSELIHVVIPLSA